MLSLPHPRASSEILRGGYSSYAWNNILNYADYSIKQFSTYNFLPEQELIKVQVIDVSNMSNGGVIMLYVPRLRLCLNMGGWGLTQIWPNISCWPKKLHS